MIQITWAVGQQLTGIYQSKLHPDGYCSKLPSNDEAAPSAPTLVKPGSEQLSSTPSAPSQLGGRGLQLRTGPSQFLGSRTGLCTVLQAESARVSHCCQKSDKPSLDLIAHVAYNDHIRTAFNATDHKSLGNSCNDGRKVYSCSGKSQKVKLELADCGTQVSWFLLTIYSLVAAGCRFNTYETAFTVGRRLATIVHGRTIRPLK